MKEIIRVENEIILAILENELNKMEVKYVIKKLDVSNLPVNNHINEFAAVFSENANEKIIKEIYNNIKESQEIEKEEHDKLFANNSILKNIFKIICIVVLLVVIIIQQMVIQNYNKSLTVSRNGYIYKWSSDLHETDIYIAKDNYLLQKNIDNDRNGIIEKSIVYYKNNIIGIYEDNNQNSFYERQVLQRDGIILLEEISSDDDGIFDKKYYYKDDKINQILNYNVIENIITLE
jgi:hypothetical protein